MDDTLSRDDIDKILRENKMLRRRLERTMREWHNYAAIQERAIKLKEYNEREKNEYINLLLENSPDILFMFDEQMNFRLGTSELLRVLGHEDKRTLVDVHFDDVFSGTMPNDWILSTRSSLESVMLEQKRIQYIEEIYFGEEKKVITVSAAPVMGSAGKIMGVICVMRDSTDLYDMEQIAYTDMLTGIINRRQFMNLASAQIDKIKRHGGEAYIVIFDLDHFKKVNDTYGHLTGDNVLKLTAQRVNNVLRSYDLFGRYGGEEFILFVSVISSEEIKTHAERIRLAICSEPMVFESATLSVSASFGVAPVSGDDIENIINTADKALYRAKSEGRNRVCFHTT